MTGVDAQAIAFDVKQARLAKQYSELEWCNWTFTECLEPSIKWLVTLDCNKEVVLSRGDNKYYKAYATSLQPCTEFSAPGATCPNCRKEVNGVNPYDDGETWRM